MLLKCLNTLWGLRVCVCMCFTSICARVLSLGLLRYSCSSRASDGKNCPPGNAAEKLTLSTFPASASGCTLNTNTSSGETESTADTPSRKWVSSGDRKCSWDMFWSRTVMLLLSISSVMMRTRNTHWALTLWMPSEKIRQRKMKLRRDNKLKNDKFALYHSMCKSSMSNHVRL